VKIGIPTEIHPGEKRVGATPDTVKKLVKMGLDVVIQAGAGQGAKLADNEYEAAGAAIAATAEEVWRECDIVAKVRAPMRTETVDEITLKRPEQLLISLIFPGHNQELLAELAGSGGSVIALDQIPRISRAQKMDVLSSMANIAGYRAVIEAANHFGSFFGGQITAAGRTRPARVLVIGAGVAGLAAIAAARSLGAEVRGFDVRPAVKDQIESLGASFLELQFEEQGAETAGGYAKTMSPEFIAAEMALFAAQAREVDIIITTALIPGKPAPLLITKEMVDSMRRGSVVVDLAAEQGGNCGYTIADRVIEVNGVTVIGYTDLTSRLATHASQFFGTNIVNLLTDMKKGDDVVLDLDDVVIRKSLVVHKGRVCWPPPPDPETAVAPPPSAAPPAKAVAPAKSKGKGHGHSAAISSSTELSGLIGLAGTMLVLGAVAPPDFVQHFAVFILACFIGWRVVWNVTPALHTPLMSVTNAISGIIIVGGLLQAAGASITVGAALGAVAILFASINIAGGFLVTQRMLAMFRREGA